MIKIEIMEAGSGKWFFREASGRTEGLSRQPLLDACRALKLMGGDTALKCGLFRVGSSDPDLVCTIEEGARLTVSEPSAGGGPRFVKWVPYPEKEFPDDGK